MLHEENASILTLLPSLAKGLISLLSDVELILKFIDQEVAKSRQNQQKLERLLHVRNQLETVQIETNNFSLSVDDQKSILLAYTFGEMYTPALALLTGKHISVQFWGSDHGILSWQTLDKLIMGSAEECSIFIQVSNNPTIESKPVMADVNPFLQLRSMVAKLGLVMNLSTFDLEKSDILPSRKHDDDLSENNGTSDETTIRSTPIDVNVTGFKPGNLSCIPVFPNNSNVVVDLRSWFCSCEDFTTKSFVAHDRSAAEILGQVTSVLNFFKDESCRYPGVLPICKHLLAVIFMLNNWSAALEAGLVRTCWLKNETTQMYIGQ